jgi:hypothetical protein
MQVTGFAVEKKLLPGLETVKTPFPARLRISYNGGQATEHDVSG